MKEKFWIVWNEKLDVMIFKYSSKNEAEIEAERLAHLHRAETFTVLEAIASVSMDDVKWWTLEEKPR